MTLIRKSEYAKRHGVSRAAVGKWVREGRVIIVDDLVDVEASDAQLERYRRYGLAPGNRGSGAKKLTSGLRAMTPAKATEMIEQLDWTIDHDWSVPALALRAERAAKCVGWVAITSELRDDGHYGEFQLRQSGVSGRGAVIAGFGFELSAGEVITICRAELEPDDDDGDFKMSVHPELFPALALPHWKEQCR